MASPIEDFIWKIERELPKQLGAIVNDEAKLRDVTETDPGRLPPDGFVARLHAEDRDAWMVLDKKIAIAAAGFLFERPRKAIATQAESLKYQDDDVDAVGEVVNQLASTINEAVASAPGESARFSFTEGTDGGVDNIAKEKVLCFSGDLDLAGCAQGTIALVLPRDVLMSPEDIHAADEAEEAAAGGDDGMSLTPEELAAIREATRESAAVGKTLLVVPLSRDRDGWSELLADAEFDYEFAPDVVGLTRALRSGEYDSVVVDADACPSGGLPALTLIREASGGNVPAVVVASSPTRTHLLSCVAAGAKGYLAKPVEPGLLVDTLGSL